MKLFILLFPLLSFFYETALGNTALIQRKANNVIHAKTLKLSTDGQTLCTRQLQDAIDRLSNHKGGVLVLDPGVYRTGSIELKSGVTLILERGAVLLGSTNPYDYNPVKTNVEGLDTRADNASMALIVAHGARHIAIDGEGVIDGNGLQLALNVDSLHHTGELVDAHYNVRRQRPSELVRPKLVFFSACSDVKISNLTCKSAANWGLSFERCQDMVLQRLKIENRAFWNNDGIDLTDCERVLVKGCNVNAADDGICLKSYHTELGNRNIHITDCDIISSASAVKFGTASWGAFFDIEIDNIRVKDTFRSAIAIESVDGALIERINVHDIHAVNTGNAIFVRLGQRAGKRSGIIRDLTIRNLYCQVPFGRPDEAYDLRGPEVDFFHNPFPSSICGIPGNRIEGVLLENIEVSFPGRATRGMAYMPLWRADDVPEQIDKYPEFSMFGELPAWGFYLRHINGITIRNTKLMVRDFDFRPAIVAEDVMDIVMERLQTFGDSGLLFYNVIKS